MDGRAHQVQAGGTGGKPYPILPALADDFGLFQVQFLNTGHNNAVPSGLNLLQGAFDFVIRRFGFSQLQHTGQKAGFICDGKAGFLAQNLEKDIRLNTNPQLHLAAGKVHAGQGNAGCVGTVQLGLAAGHIPHFVHAAGQFQQGLVDRTLQPVPRFQHGDPGRHRNGNFPQWELIKQLLQDIV